MMAYITRYIFGTDKIRPNSFEVRGMNGSHTGVIHSPDLAVLSHWIKLISDYINGLTGIKVRNEKVSFFFLRQIESRAFLTVSHLEPGDNLLDLLPHASFFESRKKET